MTGPHLAHTQSDAVLNHFSADGLEGLPGAISLLINAAMKIERSQHLQATANERTDQRTDQRPGFANGFKSKTPVTRSGPVTLAIPQIRDCETPFYPKAFDKIFKAQLKGCGSSLPIHCGRLSDPGGGNNGESGRFKQTAGRKPRMFCRGASRNLC